LLKFAKDEYLTYHKKAGMFRERSVLRAFILLFLFSCLALILPRANRAARKQAEEPRYGGTLHIRALTSSSIRTSLDPAGDSPPFLIEQVYDGLVKLDANLKVTPSLAEYWVISGDGKRQTFYLRKGVKFHHGRELDAEDVKFSLERLVRRDMPGGYFQYFTGKVLGAQEFYEGKAKDVSGFRVLDRLTFEIQWLDPDISALYLLSMDFCKVLPRDLVSGREKSFFGKPSGTGPFRFARWLRGPRLELVGARLERNEDYYGKKAYLEAIEFSPFYTLDHFLDREIDIMPYISERLADIDCKVLEDESFTPVYLGMSCHIPPLDMPIVRRALARGIDKKEVAKAAFRLDTIPRVTNNFIPAKLPGFFPADQKDTYNPDESRKLLQKEGFINETSFPPFNLYFESPKTDEDSKIYRVLRDELAVLGIRLSLKYYTSPSDLKTSPNPYLVVIRWPMDFPDAENVIKPLFESRSATGLRLIHYANPAVDELVKKTEEERSWTERNALFRRIEAILNEDLPALPLFSQGQRLALQPYVRGVRVPPLGFAHLEAKEIWLSQ
jgi:ABC-type transport system substrate-binding protein